LFFKTPARVKLRYEGRIEPRVLLPAGSNIVPIFDLLARLGLGGVRFHACAPFRFAFMVAGR
jgi:hypothetical protein